MIVGVRVKRVGKNNPEALILKLSSQKFCSIMSDLLKRMQMNDKMCHDLN